MSFAQLSKYVFVYIYMKIEKKIIRKTWNEEK